jgi:hypothetical protein
MSKMSRDQSAGNLHPRESLFISGTLGALNAEIILASDGAASFGLDLRGTFAVTVEVAGTLDGVNWTPIPLRMLNNATVQYQPSVGLAGAFVGRCAPYRQIRARCVNYTSGAATTVLTAHTAPLDDTLIDNIAPLLVTAIGAVGVAQTLTLPSPGGGLRHYITALQIERIASTALTAAAAPTAVTSTNIPGAAAWSIAADAAAVGQIYTKDAGINKPLAVSAQATATTIVAPATPGVIWRLTAHYYVAP